MIYAIAVLKGLPTSLREFLPNKFCKKRFAKRVVPDRRTLLKPEHRFTKFRAFGRPLPQYDADF